MAETLTYEQVKKLFDYKENGELIRKVWVHSSCKIGDTAGSLHFSGYFCTQVFGEQYYNHRLVWLWHYGYFPEHQIDHINRDKTDNRIENLREVTKTCNSRNTGNFCNNTSGVKGVFWYKKSQKWCASITVAGKTVNLGYYLEFLEAVCHRLAAEQAENWDGCDSSSPAYQYVQKASFR